MVDRPQFPVPDDVDQGDGPTPASFQAELEQVISRHNDLFRKIPGYMVGMLLHEADATRARHGLDLEILATTDDSIALSVGDNGAVLGVAEDPGKTDALVAELDADLQFLGLGQGEVFDGA